MIIVEFARASYNIFFPYSVNCQLIVTPLHLQVELGVSVTGSGSCEVRTTCFSKKAERLKIPLLVHFRASFLRAEIIRIMRFYS